MNRPLRVESQSTGAPLPNQQMATVRSVEGHRCQLDLSGTTCSAFISPHLLSLQPDQRVVALHDSDNDAWLVIAVWPTEADETPFRFDAQTGALHIEAPRLHLSALGRVELHCGDARISLSVDGKVAISGTEVLSSAIGSQRIEGATIDLN
jgi:hypothetical protein